MDKRSRNEIEKRQPFKPQSRIADYIRGKLTLDQIVNKDRIIKPEERHNKRAFLPHINEDVKIMHRKINNPKTIEVRIDTRRPKNKSRVKEYDETTNTFRTPKPSKRKVILDLDDCCLMFNKSKGNAIEFNKFDESAETQLPTPSTQSPCNDLIPILSNINDNMPDTAYYEETLVTKNDEISMLKEKIRNLQKSIIAKNNTGGDQENVLNKVLESLTQIATVMKILKNTDDDRQISKCVAEIEQEQDKWYSYVATVSDGMKYLKESNSQLKNDNISKINQLEEKQIENQNLQKKLLNLKQETVALKAEKIDYMDMLSASKHNLKLAQKENENLRKEVNDYKRVGEKATEQIDMIKKACEKVQLELESKQQKAMELEEKLRLEINRLESDNNELILKYEQANEEISRLGKKFEQTTTITEEIEQRYQNEIETMLVAKDNYIETLRNEADRLKADIAVLKQNMQDELQKNEQSYAIIAQLANENLTMKDDAKYLECEKQQLQEAITEWNMNSIHDSSNLIHVIDNLKMRLVSAETNYSNRLMENLEQTVKFTHFNEQSD